MLAFASEALIAPVLAWIAVFALFVIAAGSCAPTCTACERRFCPIWMSCTRCMFSAPATFAAFWTAAALSSAA